MNFYVIFCVRTIYTYYYEMKFNRKRTRKFLFQKLYALSYSDYNDALFNESFYEGKFNFDIDTPYLEEMMQIIVEKEPIFIEILQKYSPKFDAKTMNIVYVLPIFIGFAEMFFIKEEIPGKVSINEAVETAKVYGDDSAKKIVNGVLNTALENIDEVKTIIETSECKNDFSFFNKIA